MTNEMTKERLKECRKRATETLEYGDIILDLIAEVERLSSEHEKMKHEQDEALRFALAYKDERDEALAVVAKARRVMREPMGDGGADYVDRLRELFAAIKALDPEVKP